MKFYLRPWTALILKCNKIRKGAQCPFRFDHAGAILPQKRTGIASRDILMHPPSESERESEALRTSQQKQYIHLCFRYFIEYNFALMAVAHSFVSLHCTFLFLLPFYTLNKNYFLCAF